MSATPSQKKELDFIYSEKNFTIEKISLNFVVSDKYKIYQNYSDNNFSHITERREIIIDSSHQVLTQEVNSQYIPFEMPRYFDGIDLMSMSLVIHYLNSQSQENHSIPINVSYNDEKIRFHWLIDENVTCVAGEIIFEIIAYGKNEKQEKYIWKSRPNGILNVDKSLSGNSIISCTNPFYTQLVEELKKQVESAANYANMAKKYALKIETQMGEIKNQILQEVIKGIDNIVAEKLNNYCTKTEMNQMMTDILNPEYIDGNF